MNKFILTRKVDNRRIVYVRSHGGSAVVSEEMSDARIFHGENYARDVMHRLNKRLTNEEDRWECWESA